ncbi:hypothetical protein D3C78_1851770 [compost metagenome]
MYSLVRSSATRSLGSAITQMVLASRLVLRQMSHGSSALRFEHTEQNLICSLAAMSAWARLATA